MQYALSKQMHESVAISFTMISLYVFDTVSVSLSLCVQLIILIQKLRPSFCIDDRTSIECCFFQNQGLCWSCRSDIYSNYILFCIMLIFCLSFGLLHDFQILHTDIQIFQLGSHDVLKIQVYWEHCLLLTDWLAVLSIHCLVGHGLARPWMERHISNGDWSMTMSSDHRTVCRYCTSLSPWIGHDLQDNE